MSIATLGGGIDLLSVPATTKIARYTLESFGEKDL
jgi:hypothetical protein